MSLQDILQKILDEAKVEIDRIKDDLKTEKDSLLKESNEEEKLLEKSIEDKKEATLSKVTKKIDSMARREVKQKMLAVRHEIVTKAMKEFSNHLSSLSDEKYGEIIKKLFSRITENEGVVLTASNRIEVTKKFIPKGFSIESDDSVKAGFIAKLGNSEVDNSFENLLFSEFYGKIRAFFAEKLDLI